MFTPLTLLLSLLVLTRGAPVGNNDSFEKGQIPAPKPRQSPPKPTPRTPFCDLFEFEVNAELGEGADGITFNATRKADGKFVALKKLNAFSIEMESTMEHEINLMRRVKRAGFSPDIICYGEAHDFVVMELVDGTTMGNVHSYFDPQKSAHDQFADFARQMISHGKALHSLDVLHLDMHMGNWLVDRSGRIHLIDFSRGIDLQNRGSTPAHLSGNTDYTFNKASDVVDCGFILDDLYHLLLRHEEALLGIDDEDKSRRYRPEFKNMITDMTEYDLIARPSFAEVFERYFA
jgi:predicted Ser/Thr protein kinase